MSIVAASSASGTVHKWMDWLKPSDTGNTGFSLERGAKGALVGGAMIGTLVGVGTGGLAMWKPHLNINPVSSTGRAALVAGLAMGEIGFLSTVRLPEDKAMGALSGAALGAAALAGGGTVLATAIAPKLLKNPNALAGIAFGLGAAGVALGAVIGFTGVRAEK